MRWKECCCAVAVLVAAAPASSADNLDVLKDKFAFNWHADPAKAKCVKVDDKLLAEFKSKQYRCDLEVKSNTNTGAGVRVCTKVGGRGEYLVFDTKKLCDEERQAQADNE